MMNKRYYEKQLEVSTRLLRDALHLEADETVETAIVLGTGWADAFPFQAGHTVKMRDLSGPFENVEELDGHERRYEIGTVRGKRIIVLRGRAHMNEFTFNPLGKLAVRAQVEVLFRLGVKYLILTTGTGALSADIPVGGVVLIDGWASSLGEEMPLFAGEFCNPEDTLMIEHFGAIIAAAPEGLPIVVGGHVFWLGPHFEGRRYDKETMRKAGGACVSMSVKAEAAAASLHKGVRVRALGFTTNGPGEPMEHEHHRAVAREAAPKLGELLENVVVMLDP